MDAEIIYWIGDRQVSGFAVSGYECAAARFPSLDSAIDFHQQREEMVELMTRRLQKLSRVLAERP